MKKLLSFAGIVFFVCAGLAAVRLAMAETISRQETPEAVERAIALEWPAPAAELEEMRAELDPARGREALKRAIDANPRSSSAWIALGLLEDAEGDARSAERSLLQAALVDHLYLPAWTLTNFYFRRTKRDEFWRWADRAAALGYDDFGPLLRLCDRFEPDPARLLAHFRDSRKLRAPYLNFLMVENRLDAAQQVAREMVGDRANDAYLIGLADRQLLAGNAISAMELWNAASGFPPIDSGAGRLTNGDLARAPSNLGFDWRLGRVEGIAESWRPAELTIALSGSQPEACVLLEQTIFLVPRDFRLRFDYRTQEEVTGIHWSLDAREGAPIKPSSQWNEGRFDLPRAEGLCSLRLFYRRERGTVRGEGRIEVRNVRLEGAP